MHIIHTPFLHGNPGKWEPGMYNSHALTNLTWRDFAKLVQPWDIDRFFRYIYGVLHPLLHSFVNLSVLDRSSPQAWQFETWQGWCPSEDIFHSCSATTLVCHRLYSAMDGFLTLVPWNKATIAWLYLSLFFHCRWTTRAIIYRGRWRWACPSFPQPSGVVSPSLFDLEQYLFQAPREIAHIFKSEAVHANFIMT